MVVATQISLVIFTPKIREDETHFDLVFVVYQLPSVGKLWPPFPPVLVTPFKKGSLVRESYPKMTETFRLRIFFTNCPEKVLVWTVWTHD